MKQEGDEKPSARELREALAKNREQIDKDISELGHRFHEILSPRHLLGRHPILTAGVGVVLGFLIVRRPAQVLRAASRLASLGAPLLLSSLMKGDGPGSAAVTEPSPTHDHD